MTSLRHGLFSFPPSGCLSKFSSLRRIITASIECVSELMPPAQRQTVLYVQGECPYGLTCRHLSDDRARRSKLPQPGVGGRVPRAPPRPHRASRRGRSRPRRSRSHPFLRYEMLSSLSAPSAFIGVIEASASDFCNCVEYPAALIALFSARNQANPPPCFLVTGKAKRGCPGSVQEE